MEHFGNEIIVICSQSHAPSTREHRGSQREIDASEPGVKQPGFDPDRSFRLKHVGDFYMLVATRQWLPASLRFCSDAICTWSYRINLILMYNQDVVLLLAALKGLKCVNIDIRKLIQLYIGFSCY